MVLLKNQYVTIIKSQVLLPNDNTIDDFYTVTIPDAVLIIPITVNNQIILKTEYRYACKETMIECPTGMIEECEEPLHAAQRELVEETGYCSDNWTYLGPTRESPSKLTNTMHLFLAKNCICTGEQHFDPFEQIEIMKDSMDDAIKLVMDGRITSNSSAHAILKVARMLVEA